jgi:hypothetical protein
VCIKVAEDGLQEELGGCMVKVVTKEVYQAEDGTIFEDSESANKYEKSLKDLKYFYVRYGADLTEGREWLRSQAYIAVNCKGSHLDFAKILCFSKFGTEHQFCMGVFGSNAIIPYWSLTETPVTKLDPTIKILFAVEERFADKNIYGEGLWDLSNGDRKEIKRR